MRAGYASAYGYSTNYSYTPFNPVYPRNGVAKVVSNDNGGTLPASAATDYRAQAINLH
jgi:hypothetical protein